MIQRKPSFINPIFSLGLMNVDILSNVLFIMVKIVTITYIKIANNEANKRATTVNVAQKSSGRTTFRKMKAKQPTKI